MLACSLHFNPLRTIEIGDGPAIGQDWSLGLPLARAASAGGDDGRSGMGALVRGRCGPLRKFIINTVLNRDALVRGRCGLLRKLHMSGRVR